MSTSETTESDMSGDELSEKADREEQAENADRPEKGEKAEKAAGGSDRRAVAAVVGALLLVTGGLVGYGLLDSGDDRPAGRAVPTSEVTYEVLGSGSADITFLGDGEAARAGKAEVARAASLPWSRTVRVARDKQPIVSITLGEKGGRATCKLSVGGKHVQLAMASGAFGRATCSSALAAPEGAGAPGAQ